MMWRKRIFFLCALVSIFALNAWSQEAADSQAVRPSGVAGPVRKAKAVTAKDTEDADVESTPARKTKASKSTHAASHRKRAKAKRKTDEAIPAPTEVPSRRNTEDQRSVRHRGGREQRQNLIRKKMRTKYDPPASTQKLLTALIVAESGFWIGRLQYSQLIRWLSQ